MTSKSKSGVTTERKNNGKKELKSLKSEDDELLDSRTITWSVFIGALMASFVLGTLLPSPLPMSGSAPFQLIYQSIESLLGDITAPYHPEDEVIKDLVGKESEPGLRFLATTEQHAAGIWMHQVNCSRHGYPIETQVGANPRRCGTIVSDTLLSEEDAFRLRRMAAKLVASLGKSSAQERESLNLKWVELYKVFRMGPPMGLFSRSEYHLLLKISDRAKQAVSEMFGVPYESLYFADICEFTRYRPMLKLYDFMHVDKTRAPFLVLTAIVYLGTTGEDFLGGRLEFLNGPGKRYSPILVEPKLGRFAAWTSSYENPHMIQAVTAGQRLAMILGFTVDGQIGHRSLIDLFEWSLADYPQYQ